MGDEMNSVNFRLDSSNFNIDHGYLEGIVRGFKSGILKSVDYLHLTHCDTLEGTYVFTMRKCRSVLIIIIIIFPLIWLRQTLKGI